MAEDLTPLGGDEDPRAEASAANTVNPSRRRKERHRSVPLLPEVRHFRAEGLEVRSNNKTDEIIISGTPIVYERDYRVADALGEFTERMAPGVAQEVLPKADVRFLFNHDGLPLARTTAGTMALEDSDSELRFTASLDARQQLANDLAIAIQRGDVSQMSCGFIVAQDEWSEDWEDRTITRFADLLDVSAVTYPASPTTSIEVAHRMALRVPVESRARLRKMYVDLRAGRTIAPERWEVFRTALLDPGEDLETPEGTGPLGHPDGDGGTWSDPGNKTPPDGVVDASTTDGGAAGIQDGTGSRSQTSRVTALRLKRASRGI